MTTMSMATLQKSPKIVLQALSEEARSGIESAPTRRCYPNLGGLGHSLVSGRSGGHGRSGVRQMSSPVGGHDPRRPGWLGSSIPESLATRRALSRYDIIT
ncbi:MAG: hypothetical protein JWR34_6519 [Mycobacterium sp.]|nr:hypothetical protein [Mycobacterium sp.]